MENDVASVATLLRQKAEILLKSRSKKSGVHHKQGEILKLLHELEVYSVELEMQNEELLTASLLDQEKIKKNKFSEEIKQQLIHEFEVNQIIIEMQDEELKFSTAISQDVAERYSDLFNFSASGYLILSKNGEILDLNYTCARFLGKDRYLLKNSLFGFFVAENDRPGYNNFLDSIFRNKLKTTCEVRLIPTDSVSMVVQLTGVLTQNEEQCLMTLVDITERIQANEFRDMTRDVLKILNESGDIRKSVHRTLEVLKERTSSDAVGIRLKVGNDYPYYDQIGFSGNFIQSENSLIDVDKNGKVFFGKNEEVRLACACGIVLSDAAGSEDQFISPGGSWWTNELSSILETDCISDIRFHPRNQCMLEGYSSLALIPIRNNNQIVGLIQFNNFQRGIYNPTKIEALEGIASHIGSAILRKQAEETLLKNEELLRTITTNAPDVIVELDHEGTIVYMNRPYDGYTLEDCLGKDFRSWTLPEYYDEMKESLEAVFTELNTQTYQSRVRNYQGDLQWHRSRISPVQEGNVVKYAIMITRDISEIVMQEELLKESEEKRKALIVTSLDGFYITDRQGYILEVNEAYSRIIGYSVAELKTMRIHDLEIDETPEETDTHMQRITEQGEDHFETRQRCKNGVIIYVEASVQYRPVDGGQFVTFLRDITRQIQAETSLKQSDRRYKSLFQGNQSVMLLLNPDTGTILDANPAACNFYGWTYGELTHKTIFEIDPLPKGETFRKLHNSKMEKNNHLFLKHMLASGEMRDVEVYSGPIQFEDSTLLYVFVHDITESMRAQEALQQNEERYSLIYNSSRDSVYSLDMMGRFTSVNRAFCEEIQLNESQIIGNTFADLGLPENLVLEMDKLIKRVYTTNKSVTKEMKVPFLTESPRYYELELNPLHDENGIIIGIGGSARNILHRKEAQKALRESEKRFRYLVKNMPVGVLLYGSEHEFIMSNPKALELLGVEDDQLIDRLLTKKSLNAIHEDGSEFPESMHPVQQSFATGKAIHDVVMGIYRQGLTDIIWLLVDTVIIKKEDGSIRNVVCSLIDITNLKKVENELRENEQRLKYHFENSPLAVVEWDTDMIVTQWSTEAEHIFGWIKEEALGKRIDELHLIFEEDIPFVYHVIDKLRKGKKDTMVSTNRNVTKSGKVITCTWYNSILFDQNGESESVMALVQDITQRKQAEDDLRQLNEDLEDHVIERTAELLKSNEIIKIAEEKYRTVSDFAYNWEFWIDPVDRMIYCSPSCERITGYKASEFIENSDLIFDIIHPDDLLIFREHKNRELLAHVCDHEIQYRIYKKDGTVRWIGHYCSPVYDESGNFMGIRGSNKDITGRKKMLEVLTTTNKKYKLVSENITDGIFICRNGKFEYLNKAINVIFGYEGRELEKAKLTQLVTADYHEELENFLYSNGPVNRNCNLEVECIKKDLSLVNVEMLLNYVSKDTLIYGVVHDITEKKHLQKNIIKTIVQTEEKERASFSKELHDGLGPLLSTIKLYLQWSERPNSSKSHTEIVSKAEEIVEEALTTVREISNKLSPHILTLYGLEAAIKNFVDKLNEADSLVIHFESNVHQRIDAEIEATLYRAIIECINNSIKYANANTIDIRLMKTGPQIIIQYMDDGVGFNVTETLKKRSGLGLFNLMNRIHTIGGKVDLHSEPGKGVNYLFTVKI